eukprot:TRINITY_DN5497_c0_g1_i1.p1 TRINITY_DN5497_c0_g1~~TRINITY_DN5497_c0_g1_i1.p1  ORF type:complete len:211 (-),score=9.88 TRINITY_DN5497_c0_g1_i1:145-747(-)
MAQAVAHLHDNTMIHRDIALRNFLVTNLMGRRSDKYIPRVTLIDLGLARFIQDERYRPHKQRDLPWRLEAPEMSQHQCYYNSKTDVWALGLAFKHLCYPEVVPYHNMGDMRELRYFLDHKYTEEDDIANCPSPQFEKIYNIVSDNHRKGGFTAQSVRDELKILLTKYETGTLNNSTSDIFLGQYHNRNISTTASVTCTKI